MGDSLENQDVSLDAQNAVIVDYGAFANYLRKAATILLPENNNDDNYPPAVSCTKTSSNKLSLRQSFYIKTVNF